MLVGELVSRFDEVESISTTLTCYNEILGDTSFLLAGLLESLLKTNYSDWDRKKWIDDSLITNVVIRNDKVIIEGIMIWGREGTTEQWTDPFIFEIEFLKDEISFRRFTFWFCDLEMDEISYEEFRTHRDYWNARSGNWKYVINFDKAYN